MVKTVFYNSFDIRETFAMRTNVPRATAATENSIYTRRVLILGNHAFIHGSLIYTVCAGG